MEKLLEALKYQDLEMLRNKAVELKRTDGEGWAIGEMIEVACNLLEATGGVR